MQSVTDDAQTTTQIRAPARHDFVIERRENPVLTTAALKAYTSKDLAQMAKRRGVRDWHSMRKDQLVKELLKIARAKIRKSARAAQSNGAKGTKSKSKNAARPKAKAKPTRRIDPATNGRAKTAKSSTKTKSTHKSNGNKSARGKSKAAAAGKRTSPHITRQIRQAQAERARLKDLALRDLNAEAPVTRDRVVLMVRDPYWLHVCWEISRRNIQRAKAAMAENWHTAKPTLRLFAISGKTATNISERLVEDITIHGGVRNWYVPVENPPGAFRVEIGYLADGGKFFSLARSNQVTTPEPDCGDSGDANWSDVVANCERVYALSGGHTSDGSSNEVRELFEQRLKRPMGTPTESRYGVGADRFGKKEHRFNFDIETEMIIYGAAGPGAHVTLVGEPISLEPDGSFALRLKMGNRRQVLPIIAQSSDGIEQRTIVLSVERNTKVMEPVFCDPSDPANAAKR